MMTATVFIPLVSALSVDKVVALIFRLGCHVGPVANQYLLSDNDSPVALLGLSVISELGMADLRSKIQNALMENNISFYSLIVIRDHGGLAWCSSNISLKKIKSEMVRTNVPHLKLVRKTPPPLPTEDK